MVDMQYRKFSPSSLRNTCHKSILHPSHSSEHTRGKLLFPTYYSQQNLYYSLTFYSPELNGIIYLLKSAYNTVHRMDLQVIANEIFEEYKRFPLVLSFWKSNGTRKSNNRDIVRSGLFIPSIDSNHICNSIDC